MRQPSGHQMLACVHAGVLQKLAPGLEESGEKAMGRCRRGAGESAAACLA